MLPKPIATSRERYWRSWRADRATSNDAKNARIATLVVTMRCSTGLARVGLALGDASR